MAQPTLEQRVAALEREVARLAAHPGNASPPEKNWRSTIGMFAGDDTIKEIIEEGRRIREADRQQAHE